MRTFVIDSFADFAFQACGLESAAHHHANQTVCLAILVRALEPWKKNNNSINLMTIHNVVFF